MQLVRIFLFNVRFQLEICRSTRVESPHNHAGFLTGGTKSSFKINEVDRDSAGTFEFSHELDCRRELESRIQKEKENDHDDIGEDQVELFNEREHPLASGR